MPNSPLITVKSIYLHPRDDSRMWGAWIDLPVAGTTRDVYSLSIVGWVLSRGPRAVAVEYLHAGTVLGNTGERECAGRLDCRAARLLARDRVVPDHLLGLRLLDERSTVQQALR